MAEKLSFFINTVLKKFSQETFLLIALIVLTLGLTVNLLITFFSVEYKKRNRVWFCLLCGGVVVLQSGLAILSGEENVYAVLLTGISFFYCIPVFFVSSKKRKLKKEQQELIKFLDSQIKTVPNHVNKQNVGETFDNKTFPISKEGKSETTEVCFTGENVQTLKPPSAAKRNEHCDLPDFSHVKNIISRLNDYALSPFDKKQVHELEINLAIAEKSGECKQMKEKINDGLSALLKIMSKYGV